MQENSVNIYKTARITSGLTQERWSEMLGVSVESIRLYESGRGLPSDEVVARMAEVAVLPVLAYWHIKNKSGVANDLLPEVETVPLPQAVLQLLTEIRKLTDGTLDALIDIASDGIIEDDERSIFGDILEDLDGVIRAAWTVKYAKREA